MASGVKVADEVKDLYNAMKIVKNDADAAERIRLVSFTIDDTTIVIEKQHLYKAKDLEGKDPFKVFLSLLEPQACRYILYDCHYETKESPKEDLIFVMWADSSAKLKCKMHYASSKDSIKKVFAGIKHSMELQDISDVSTRETFVEALGKGKSVIKLECLPCGCSS